MPPIQKTNAEVRARESLTTSEINQLRKVARSQKRASIKYRDELYADISPCAVCYRTHLTTLGSSRSERSCIAGKTDQEWPTRHPSTLWGGTARTALTATRLIRG